MCDFTIQPKDIDTYKLEIKVTGDWVSFRHPDFAPNSASKQASRYNHDGDTAYYLASGYNVAQAEVKNWPELNPYKVQPTTVYAFNVAQWSQDKGLYDEFIKSKEDNGHGLCQKLTDQLTGVYGLTGILYNSQPMNAVGQTGYCLVVLPERGEFVDDTFFIKDNDFKE